MENLSLNPLVSLQKQCYNEQCTEHLRMAKHDGQACERYAWLSNRISIVTEIIKNPEMLLWNQISLFNLSPRCSLFLFN